MSTTHVESTCDTPQNKYLRYVSNCTPIYSELLVYNRWGKLVFKELNKNKGFEGMNNTLKGDKDDLLLPSGSYFYVFSYKFNPKQEDRKLTGTVSFLNKKQKSK